MNGLILSRGSSKNTKLSSAVPSGVRLIPAPLAQQGEASNGDEDTVYVPSSSSPSSLPSLSDEKFALVETKVPTLIAAPRSRPHASLSGAKGRQTVVAPLSFYTKTAGSANTAFAVSIPLQPDADSSWSSWIGVFDEFKVLSAEVHWNVWFSTLPSGFPAQSPNAAMAYDPTSSVSLGAVNQVMDYEKFQLLNCGANASGTFAVAPQALSQGGHMVFRTGRLPNDAQISKTETLLSTGVWRPTEDVQDYNWGSFVAYVAAGGTSAVLQLEAMVRMQVEFRVRR